MLNPVKQLNILCLIALSLLSFTNISLAIAAPIEGKWRTISPEGVVSTWHNEPRAAVGFTNHRVEIVLTPEKTPQDSVHHLIISPTYIDRIEAIFSDHKGVIKRAIFGDKVELPKEIEHISGFYKIEIPWQTSQIKLFINSTSNISLTPKIVSNHDANNLKIQGTFFQTLLITILVLSAVLGLISYLASGSIVALTFTFYQIAWSILIIGVKSPTPFDWLSFHNTTYDWIVSYGVILALITGASCHAMVFKTILESKLGWFLFSGVAVAGGIFFVALTLGYEQQTLKSNALLLSLAPVLIITLLTFTKVPKKAVKVKVIYFVLMISVLITGLSGIGFGYQFNVTYIHSLLTTLLMSMIIIGELLDKRKEAEQISYSLQLSNNQKEQTARSLEESRSMLAMLAHEIKTPLTTLRFISDSYQDKGQMTRQLDSITHVIDQTLRASDIQDAVINKERINIEFALLQSWSNQAKDSHFTQLDLRCDPEQQIQADPFSFKVIIDNLFSNALKYGSLNSTIRVFSTFKNGQLHLVVSNASSNLKEVDSTNIFSKYWRAPDAKRHRGTGLGLWIVKNLCEKQGIGIEVKLTETRFRAILKFQHFQSTDPSGQS
jgi:signal transduction histidine kinase